MSTHQQIVDGLSAEEHELFKVTEWGAINSEDVEAGAFSDTRELVEDVNDADIITSKIKGSADLHTIMLDLDVPAKLVPSSTEGHSHLYIDVKLDRDRYARLLGALQDAGVIQFGFAWGFAVRGATSLRLPWVTKESVTDDLVQDRLF